MVCSAKEVKKKKKNTAVRLRKSLKRFNVKLVRGVKGRGGETGNFTAGEGGGDDPND